jgi:hypothetical protein
MSNDSTESALEMALRDFEPLFWASPWAERLDRLYEPDGTLYAICLEGPTELTTDRRKVVVHTGDLVIIPPAVAIDTTPAARWFGIVYTGPYPYHFRERFIQVWGFEHVALSTLNPTEIQPPDHRHRIYISNTDFSEITTGDSNEFHLRLSFSPGSAGPEITWAQPGQPLAPSNNNLFRHNILFRIPLEATYLNHREARPQRNPAQTLSPEFRPDANPA